MSELYCKEIETHPSSDAAVIWLHGLGATCDDFVPIVPELNLPANARIRFIFPQAPSIPVTVNGGMVMPAWYDIYHIDIDRKIDHGHILESSGKVQALIEREISRGISSERIVIAGFSQGGAVAYQAALTFRQPLGGLLAMSTYFATHDSLTLAAENAALPISISHGRYDPVVPESLGQQAVAHLQALGLSPEYQTYPMQHEVCMPQIVAISQWLQARLRAK